MTLEFCGTLPLLLLHYALLAQNMPGSALLDGFMSSKQSSLFSDGMLKDGRGKSRNLCFLPVQ